MIAGWAKPTGIGLAQWPHLNAFIERIGRREAVKARLMVHKRNNIMDPRHADIAEALSDYFDGLHHSDTQRLAGIFHPGAIYACATEGSLTRLGMDEYFPIVDQRPSPASRGEGRTDRIISIEFAGPVTALVRAECSIGAKHFTDFLTLICLDGRWRIIAKVFHFDVKEAA